MFAKAFKIAGGVALVVLATIQLLRPDRTNPASDPGESFEAVAQPPQAAASSLKRACGDCHSNQTVWPWYSNIAPVSWLVASDVNEGRAHLNFSEWTRPGPKGEKPDLGEVCEQVKAGKMPPRSYTLVHPQAKLSDGEVTALCALSVAGTNSAGAGEEGGEDAEE